MPPCLWCLHGEVEALHLLSRFSLSRWCQALAAKKDDFINDLINHQNSRSPHISLIHSARPSLLELLPRADISHTHTHRHTQIETHTDRSTPALFPCNTSSLVLSLSSPDFNLLPLWPAGSKSAPKSKVTTIQDASRSGGGGITTTKGQLSPSLRRTGEDNSPVQQISSSFHLFVPPPPSLTTCWAHRASLPGWIKASAFGSTGQTFRLVI